MTGHELAPAVLSGLVHLGRSSRHHWRRHGILHRSYYERLAAESAGPLRGRALRLLGREKEARAALRGLKGAEARAYLWDLGLAPASALETAHPWWRGWAAAAALERRPEKALELAQGTPLSSAVSGLAYMRLRQWEEAAASFDEDEAWQHRQRSRALLRLGDVEAFVAACSRSILLEEGIGDLAPGLGPMESYEPAVLARAAEGRSEWWALALRGDCKRSPEVGDRDGARRDLERAAELEPGCAWVWAYLGRARDSAADLDRAAGLAPECGWIRIWRGQLRLRAGDAEGGLSDLDAGLALSPDYELGYAWRGTLPDLELAAEFMPDHAWTLERLARAYRDAGRYEEALARLDQARRLSSKFEWSREELEPLVRRSPLWRGEWRRRGGDLKGALADLARAPKGDALAALWRARAWRDSGRPERALRELERPGTAEAWLERGELLLSLGRAGQAERALERATRLDGGSARAYHLLGEARLSLGRLEEARASLDLCLQLDPKNRRAQEARDECYNPETRRGIKT